MKIIWAVYQKKDGYEHKKGDIVEVSLWRRNLMQRYNRKYQKIIKLSINPAI